MLAADPELKPTTAIRNLGIQDPSIIRRLRDKFAAFRSECESDLAISERDLRQRLRADNDDAGARSICLDKPRDPRLQQVTSERDPIAARPPGPVAVTEMVPPIPPAAATPGTLVPRVASQEHQRASPPVGTARATRTPVPDPANDAARVWSALLTAGMRAASAAFKAQVELGSQAMLSPPAVAALRFQLAWNSYFIALVGPQAGDAHR
ncbi:MAG: hypothetical protein NW205_07280 [Hyphomicrobiaceae bacterium]|nr:hypothetical protein [Hyphomicrobiaceae bacterium]